LREIRIEKLNALYKFRTIVLVCVASLLLASCSDSSQQNNSLKTPSFSEYQDMLKQLDTQISNISRPLTADFKWNLTGNIERWWGCKSYDIDSYSLKTKNTAPWKLFGYCLTSIDDTVQRPQFQIEHSGSFNEICKTIIRREIDQSYKSVEISKFITSEVNDAIVSGCTMRFVDTFNIVIKSVELNIEYEPIRIEAEKKQAAIEKQQAIEAAKRAKAEDNPINDEPSPKGKWVSKCRWITIPNPNAPGRLKDQIESGISPTLLVQRCTDVYVQP